MLKITKSSLASAIQKAYEGPEQLLVSPGSLRAKRDFGAVEFIIDVNDNYGDKAIKLVDILFQLDISGAESVTKGVRTWAGFGMPDISRYFDTEVGRIAQYKLPTDNQESFDDYVSRCSLFVGIVLKNIVTIDDLLDYLLREKFERSTLLPGDIEKVGLCHQYAAALGKDTYLTASMALLTELSENGSTFEIPGILGSKITVNQREQAGRVLSNIK